MFRLVARCERLLGEGADVRVRVVRALSRALGHHDVNVAIRAAYALASRPSAETSAALAQHLGLGGSEVRTIVEGAIADRHRADPTPFIDWMMGTDRTETMAAATRALGRMGNRQTVPLLHELARSSSLAVRIEASRALDRIASLEPSGTSA